MVISCEKTFGREFVEDSLTPLVFANDLEDDGRLVPAEPVHCALLAQQHSTARFVHYPVRRVDEHSVDAAVNLLVFDRQRQHVALPVEDEIARQSASVSRSSSVPTRERAHSARSHLLTFSATMDARLNACRGARRPGKDASDQLPDPRSSAEWRSE